jgi:signal transduction histidine kinase
LARELHDSTGQVLGYADFQLDAISNHVQDGQSAVSAGQMADANAHLAEAEKQLTRLRRITEEAHADLREYILNLRSAPSDGRVFLETLRSYLDGFSQNYDIQTELSIAPDVDAEDFALGTQLQLFRIIQEALSNARKHSAARRVQVTIEGQDSRIRISVHDNGRGLDPGWKADDTGHHFGLRFMRERAEQIGGSLQLMSAPGQGTSVIVEVPIKGQ